MKAIILALVLASGCTSGPLVCIGCYETKCPECLQTQAPTTKDVESMLAAPPKAWDWRDHIPK